MFNQLQDAQLVASSGGAVGPTPFQMEAFSAAREQGVCQSERREGVQNYIQINGTPEQLAEIAERDRINERVRENMAGRGDRVERGDISHRDHILRRLRNRV